MSAPRRKSVPSTALCVAAALALLAVAWLIAHYPPVRRAAELDDPSINIGYNLLIASALPWTLQAAALALLLATLGRRLLRADAAAGCLGIAFPFFVGLAWWTGLVASLWNADPLEAGLRMSMSFSERALDDPLLDIVLHEIVGPIVFPFKLAGAYNLSGANFFLAGLSTALVFVYWTFMGKWMRVDFSFKWPSPRMLMQMAVAIFVYLIPASLPLAQAIVHVVQELA